MADDHRDKLDAGEVTTDLAEVQPDEFTIDWSKYLAGKLSDPVDTTVKRATLDKLAKAINTIPDGVELHPRVAKIYEVRRKMVAGEQPGGWGIAENLACATLLDESCQLRLVAQDSGRAPLFPRPPDPPHHKGRANPT